jgi:heme-degrading monooxygenase HmoA
MPDSTASDPTFALGLQPPYYAVIFSSRRTPGDTGYGATSQRMTELAATQPGYLGIESVRGPDGFGITISYWRDAASIRAWKDHAEHLLVQEHGRKNWYEHFELRVARVERAYDGPTEALHPTAWG